jgi:hypothetical protein
MSSRIRDLIFSGNSFQLLCGFIAFTCIFFVIFPALDGTLVAEEVAEGLGLCPFFPCDFLMGPLMIFYEVSIDLVHSKSYYYCVFLLKTYFR